MKKTLNFILLTIMGGISIATAQTPAVMVSDKASWHKIGERTVDFTKDNDEIVVIGADRFASIQFKVKDAPIELISLEVYYDSGDKQNIIVNSSIKINGESKIIDLNGGERDLKKIVFVYKTVPNTKDVKALVEVWGFKTNVDTK